MSYVVIEKTNWKTVFEITVTFLFSLISIVFATLMYDKTFFLFYIPFFKDGIAGFLFLNGIIWLWIFVYKFFEYKPKEERLRVCNTIVHKDRK